LLSPAASERVGLAKAWNVVVLSVSMPSRFEAEYRDGAIASDDLWIGIREFTPRYLVEHPQAIVARCSTTHMGMKRVLSEAGGAQALVARAASGIVYAYDPVLPALPRKHILEHGPGERWPHAGPDFAVMRQIKEMFDPKGLLNKGALYGRI
jgi:FAD/FMN-containing dehydrogenase